MTLILEIYSVNLLTDLLLRYIDLRRVVYIVGLRPIRASCREQRETSNCRSVTKFDPTPTYANTQFLVADSRIRITSALTGHVKSQSNFVNEFCSKWLQCHV